MFKPEKKAAEKIFKAVSTPEGDGAKDNRIISGKELETLDPFVFLDQICLRLPAGYPDHPHRGLETVTYVKKGKMFYEDFTGRKGIINAGDVQWMTAGKAIEHSVMPASFNEDCEGFILWVNLEKKNKFCESKYQEIKCEKIPVVDKNGVRIHVIAGNAFGVDGPVETKTPILFLDVEMKENKVFSEIIPKYWNSLCYAYEGCGKLGAEGKELEKNTVAVLRNEINDNEVVEVRTEGKPLNFLLLAGHPIGEPTKVKFPFSMNTENELVEAEEDFKNCRQGFEAAKNWESEIRHLKEPKFYEDFMKKWETKTC